MCFLVSAYGTNSNSDKNLDLKVYREIPRNLRFAIWWISGMKMLHPRALHFASKSYIHSRQRALYFIVLLTPHTADIRRLTPHGETKSPIFPAKDPVFSRQRALYFILLLTPHTADIRGCSTHVQWNLSCALLINNVQIRIGPKSQMMRHLSNTQMTCCWVSAHGGDQT